VQGIDGRPGESSLSSLNPDEEKEKQQQPTS
jgi:hypothetical protein